MDTTTCTNPTTPDVPSIPNATPAPAPATKEPVLVSFTAYEDDVYWAGARLRIAVRIIGRLSNSLLGDKPSEECIVSARLNSRQHFVLRKFQDLEGLRVYKQYLAKKVALNKGQFPVKFSNAGVDGEGFTYQVASGLAMISLAREKENSPTWTITGNVTLRNPDGVARHLRKNWFNVKVSPAPGHSITAEITSEPKPDPESDPVD